MLYPDYDLAGAEWDAPAYAWPDSKVVHHWAGWRWRVLRAAPTTARHPDMWVFEREHIATDTRRPAELGHGIELRDWMRRPQPPAYDPEHIRRLVIVDYYGRGFGLARARQIYDALGYDEAIKELRSEMVQRAGGYSGGHVSYSTWRGKLEIKRPLELAIPLVEVARVLFPEPGKPVQLTLF